MNNHYILCYICVYYDACEVSKVFIEFYNKSVFPENVQKCVSLYKSVQVYSSLMQVLKSSGTSRSDEPIEDPTLNGNFSRV